MNKPLTADEQEYYDDLLGRGPGDPDMRGYPGEPEEEILPDDNTTDPNSAPF